MSNSAFAIGDRVVRRGTDGPVGEVTRADTSYPYVHIRFLPIKYQTDCILGDDLVHARLIEAAYDTPKGDLLEQAVSRGAPAEICTAMHAPGKPAGHWADASVCGFDPTYVRADRFHDLQARADRLAETLQTLGAAIGRRIDPEHIDGPILDDGQKLATINAALTDYRDAGDA